MKMTMKTPQMYLGLENMPRKLPFKGFSWELNRALMAESDSERAAGAMFIQCLRNRDAFDIETLSAKALENQDDDLEYDIDAEILHNDVVGMIIDKQLQQELNRQKATKPVNEVMCKTAMKKATKSVNKVMKSGKTAMKKATKSVKKVMKSGKAAMKKATKSVKKVSRKK